MNALTLHQPWASLIAHGVKTIETRSWAPPRHAIGQELAIHAGATVTRPSVLRWNAPETLAAIEELYGEDWPRTVPTKQVVAICKLAYAVHVEKVGNGFWGGGVRSTLGSNAPAYLTGEIDPHGGFGVGRWLWFLEDIEEPPQGPFNLHVRGAQRLWDWKLPPYVEV